MIEGVKEVFISAEVLGSVFSIVSCAYLQRWSECLILSMHCRADSHACVILVYEILQIETYGAILNRCVGFFLYTSSEPVELIKFSTTLRDIFLCGSIHSLVVADVPFPLGKAEIMVAFSLFHIWRNSSETELFFAYFSLCCLLPPHLLSPFQAVCHVVSIVLALMWQFIPVRFVVVGSLQTGYPSSLHCLPLGHIFFTSIKFRLYLYFAINGC